MNCSSCTNNHKDKFLTNKSIKNNFQADNTRVLINNQELNLVNGIFTQSRNNNFKSLTHTAYFLVTTEDSMKLLVAFQQQILKQSRILANLARALGCIFRKTQENISKQLLKCKFSSTCMFSEINHSVFN